jgi:hypothetical protein
MLRVSANRYVETPREVGRCLLALNNDKSVNECSGDRSRSAKIVINVVYVSVKLAM